MNQDDLAVLTRGLPPWAQARHEAGFEALAAASMPTGKEEIWRYLDFDFSVADYRLAGAPESQMPPSAHEIAIGDTVGRAVVIDGHVVGTDADEKLNVLGLRAATTTGDEQVIDAYQPVIDPDHDVFAAVAAAAGFDGVYIQVPDGYTEPRPYLIDVQALTPGSLSIPRLSLEVGDGAEASVVMVLRSEPDLDALVLPQVSARLGDNAHLRLTTIQDCGYATRAVGHQRMSAGRDATLRFGEVGLGGKLSRLHLTVDLVGRGARAEVSGAYFGEDHQVLDYRYFMNHIGPQTTSNMFLKGALEDDAVSVFTGLIRIEKEAQKTEAFQTNRNLVLSDGALANSVPNLEILANDVKCGHGSTVGPLDEEQRYYLMSRGLDQPRADRLQVRGFFEEALGRLPLPAAVPELRNRLNAKFLVAQEAGRI